MARFDIYVNPNRASIHSLFVDVQSDHVALSSRWCIPLLSHTPSRHIMQGAQAITTINKITFVLDTPNLLAVPAAHLRRPIGRLTSGDQLMAESCIEFMLRGY